MRKIILLTAILSTTLLFGCGKKELESNIVWPDANQVTTNTEVTKAPSVDEADLTPEATPTPSPRPEYGVTTIGLYKNYGDEGKRKLVNDSFSSKWVAQTDISSFEAIASTDSEIATNGRYFQDLWKEKWNSFSDNSTCKIGYIVDYDLTDGTHISQKILHPGDELAYKNYIEIYLYDDINQTPGQWYSHIIKEQENENTILSSIKFTCGADYAKVSGEITLTAFIYYDDLCFDSEGNYNGTVLDTIKIVNQ